MTWNPDVFITALLETNLPLAGRCAAQPDVVITPTLRSSLQQALLERTRNSRADLRARITAGLALGELGDPRFKRRQGPEGAYLLPPLVEIPGGHYTLGSNNGLYDDETPVHTVELQTFAIGQFPVTNAEWKCFMGAGGYENERWWDTAAAQAWRRGESTAEGPKQEWQEFRQYFQQHFNEIRDWQQQERITSREADQWEQIAHMTDAEFEALLNDWYPPGRQTQPAYWNDDAFNNSAQPVVGICWYEARAYCAWLSAQTGQTFRLPTEAEWEAAARGKGGRRYAYGDKFDASCCNTFEGHIRRTTPIEIFPGGETPEGLVDMTGNVWEWTGSLYQPYLYDPADGREETDASGCRVARGGAWLDSRGVARAAFRLRPLPGSRGPALGLRVGCAAPLL